MRIFNKLVFSKKEPSNKNDVWFDGSNLKIYTEGSWKTIIQNNGGGGADITIDSELSETSKNPVQNKAIKAYVDNAIASAITNTLNTEV